MSGNGIASAQGTVVFSVPASATADPCAPPQPSPTAFPVAQRSTLSPNASPFVPKNFALPVVAATATPQAPFAVAAAAPTAADSDMSYTPALPTNVQTIYVTGLPGYYAPYVPTPAVPFYAMQYQCVYQPPPPPPPHAHPAHMGGVCCPMEEGGLAPPLVADEAPPTAAMLPPGGTGPHHHLQASGPGNALLPHPPHHHQQQQPTLIIQNSGRRNKKKSRSGRRRDHASSHRDCAAVVDTGACIVNAEYGHSSAASVARHGGGMGTVPTAASRSSYEPGTASSPDFSSRSEFPSLPVQEFPPRQSPSSGGCISYSSALQQQRAPLMPSPSSIGGREGEPHSARGSQGRRGGGNADGRPHKRGGGGGGARKHRRGGGEGRRAEEAAADAAAARSQPHYPHPQPQQSPAPQQQERRGGARRGRPVAATPAVAMDGEAEKHQFEAPEKDVKGELRLPRPPVEGEGTTRANSAGGRSSNQAGGVRVNASRGRRETRHSSLLRGVLKGGAERQGLRSGGGRKGSDAAMERHPLPPSDQQQLQRPGENRTGTQEDKPSSRKNSRSFVGEDECADEYPPLGSSGGVQDKSLERTAKSDGKQDSVVKGQGDIIPKQQQSPRDKSGKQGVAPPPPALAKPLASTNSSGGGPKHKAAISMAIVDIMVPKQRQPKKLKEKENLLERSSKKPEVQRPAMVANRLDSSAPSKKRGKERETPARKRLTVMKRIILKEREERRQRKEKMQLAAAARQSRIDDSAATAVEVVIEEARQGGEEGSSNADGVETTLPLPLASEEAAVAQPEAKGLHSTRFRDYCDHVQSAEISLAVRDLLTDLVFFQDRLYQKDPIKARIKRRLVYGLREVRKYLLLNKLKCIIFATDIEEVRAEGGLDHSLGDIIGYARAHYVPTVFALKRRALGHLGRKKVGVSCVGIFDYSAREVQFKSMLELVNAARKAYTELKESLACPGDPVLSEKASDATKTDNAPSTQAVSCVLDDGWVTATEDSDSEEVNHHPAATKAAQPADVDKVTELLARSLRSAGRES